MGQFDVRLGAEVATTFVRSEPESEDVKLTRRLFEEYKSARAVWAKNALEDDEFRNNKQWTQAEIQALEEDAQVPVVVNVIHPAVEQGKALLTANRPRFSSVGRDDSDTHTGRMFSDIMTYIWDISLGNVQLKQVIDDYYVRGLGTMLAYVDPYADNGRGEVFVKAIDPFDVFVDPSSKDPYFRDAAHVIVAQSLTVEQFQRAYPQFAEIAYQIQNDDTAVHPDGSYASNQSEQIGTGSLPPNERRALLLDRYSRVRKLRWTCLDTTTGMESVKTEEDYREYLTQPTAVRMQNGQQSFVTNPGEVRQLAEMISQYGPMWHSTMVEGSQFPEVMPGPSELDPQAVPGSDVSVELSTIGAFQQMGIIRCMPFPADRILRVLSYGHVQMRKVELELEDYPLVPLCNRHNRNPYPSSDVRTARPLQKYINKIRSLIMAHAANSTNIKVFIPRGGVDKRELEAEWRKAGSAMIEYDPEIGVPIIASPTPLPNELYRNEADAKHDIEMIFGLFAMQMGDQSSAPTTYKGTIALDEFGQRRIKSKKEDVENFLNQLARVIVQLVQVTYTEEKTIRLVQPNNPPKEMKLNVPIYDTFSGKTIARINDVSAGRYDVVVVSGSMLPSNRWAQQEYYMEMYKMGLIDQLEVLKKSEVVDVEGVMERFSELARLRSAVEQLQAQVKQQAGDLQTMQREAMHANKKAELWAFKSKLSDIASRADKAASIYEMSLENDRELQQQTAMAAQTAAE